MIYFDNAATTQISDIALNELNQIAKKNYGNPSSAYSYGRRSREIIEQARETIAKCINAEPDEILFTSGGTESDNWAIHQIHKDKKIRKIITSKVEHHAIINPVAKCQEEGIKTTFLAVDSSCRVDIDELKSNLDGDPCLASIMLQNNETGSVQDIQRIANIVHSANPNSLFHTDAVQAVGHRIIDVKQLDVDLLSASAHKFNGPKGVGFLYVKKNTFLAPFILGGGQEQGVRSGTENVAGIAAMAKALDDNVHNCDLINERIEALEELLLNLLFEKQIPFRINADGINRAKGILNIFFLGVSGEGLLNYLDLHEIYLSIGSACNAKKTERSHVLQALKLADEQIDSSVRISIGRYNTRGDVFELVNKIEKYYKVVNGE